MPPLRLFAKNGGWPDGKQPLCLNTETTLPIVPPNAAGFLHALLETSSECIKILDFEGRLRFMSAGGQRVMEVDDFPSLEGCAWIDFWTGEHAAKAQAAMAAARKGESTAFTAFATTAKGSPRWWRVKLSPIRDESGEIVQLLSISTDITDQQLAQQLLQSSEASFATMANSIPQLAWMADTAGTVTWYNQRWYDYTGMAPGKRRGRHWKQLYHPDHVAGVIKRWRAAVKAGTAWEETFPIKGADEKYRWFLTRAVPLHDHAGEITRWLGTNTDVTSQREAETHQRLLMEELQHRVKNTLAIVQSIAVQTFRKAPSPEQALENFSGRLMALSRGYDVLLDESWSSADIAKVVSDAIHPHDSGRGRFRVGGPALRLAGRPALALAMVLHELSTNALKYGALSGEHGSVEIVWRIAESEGEPQLSMIWTERGGPKVANPTRKSFGTVLIQQGLGPQFGSSAELVYEPDGLVCTITAPLNTIEEQAKIPVA